YNRCFGSTNIVGFVSGYPGVSASWKGSLHVFEFFFSRAPRMTTSSASRSPEPWYQSTSRSPLGSSTIIDAWLCQCSSGTTSSDSRNGFPSAESAPPRPIDRLAATAASPRPARRQAALMLFPVGLRQAVEIVDNSVVADRQFARESLSLF